MVGVVVCQFCVQFGLGVFKSGGLCVQDIVDVVDGWVKICVYRINGLIRGGVEDYIVCCVKVFFGDIVQIYICKVQVVCFNGGFKVFGVCCDGVDGCLGFFGGFYDQMFD